jgi:hypothetical protein
MQVARLVARDSNVGTGGLGGELDFIQAMAEKVAGHNYTMTDAEKQALEAIRNVVKTMIVTIDTQHQEDQNEVNRARDDIKYCSDVAANGSLVAAGLNTGVTTARSTNSNCRNRQSTATGTQNTLCTFYHTYRKSDKAVPDTCMSNHLTESYVKTDVAPELADMENCLENTKKWIDPLYNAYKGCRDQGDVITNLTSQCNSDQSSFESKYCAWATKNDDTCDAQTQCRAHEIAKRTAVHGNVSASESARQSDYRASQKVLCFFKVFEANNANKSATLQGCINLVVDVSNYTITYPAVPAPHPCTKSTHEPCDVSWVSTEYTSQAWHSLAPAATCTPCPAPATTPAPATGYTCRSTMGSAPLVKCDGRISNMDPATQSVWDSRTPAGCNWIDGDINVNKMTESITFTGLKKVQAWVHVYYNSVDGIEVHFPDLEDVRVFLIQDNPGIVDYSVPCLTTVRSTDPDRNFLGFGNNALTDQAWLDGVCQSPIAAAGSLGNMQPPNIPNGSPRTLHCP